MSTLKVTNIQATGETASRAVSGVAAVWCNFNGTGTIASRDSFNLSSLTDNGTGHYRVNISSNFANSNYASPSSGADSTSGNVRIALPHDGDDVTASYYDIITDSTSSAASDADYVHTASFGDLA